MLWCQRSPSRNTVPVWAGTRGGSTRVKAGPGDDIGSTEVRPTPRDGPEDRPAEESGYIPAAPMGRRMTGVRNRRPRPSHSGRPPRPRHRDGADHR